MTCPAESPTAEADVALTTSERLRTITAGTVSTEARAARRGINGSRRSRNAEATVHGNLNLPGSDESPLEQQELLSSAASARRSVSFFDLPKLNALRASWTSFEAFISRSTLGGNDDLLIDGRGPCAPDGLNSRA